MTLGHRDIQSRELAPDEGLAGSLNTTWSLIVFLQNNAKVVPLLGSQTAEVGFHTRLCLLNCTATALMRHASLKA